MPINRLVVKAEIATYAGILFDAASDRGGLEAVLEVRSQMEAVIGAMRADMGLASTLSDPDAADDVRYELAKGACGACEPELGEVLAVMAERGDADLLPRVYEAYGEELSSKLDLCVVDVTTAVALDDNLRTLITRKAEADLGKKIVLRERIDKSILGGIIMDVDGNYIDASMISQLNRARNVLKDTTDGGEC